MSDNTSKSNPKNKEKKTAEPSTKRMRQSSSTSTEDTAMIIDKSELEDIIQKSIAVAMEKYQVEVKQMIEKNHSELINKIELLEHENQTLKAQKEILLTKMDVLNAENKETLTTLNNLKEEIEYLQKKQMTMNNILERIIYASLVSQKTHQTQKIVNISS